jgi:hypothetical protein
MLLVHYFLPEVGVNMEQVTSQQLLRSMSKTPQVRSCAASCSVCVCRAWPHPHTEEHYRD